MTVPTRNKGSATRPLIITLIVIVVIAVFGFAYASPYIALNNLKRAADARDVETVNQYVDFPALRDSLKLQIAGLLTRRLDADNNSKLATIGAMIGVTLIGPLVDAYATPDGVAALLNGMPPHGDPGERPPEGAAANNAPPTAAETPASPAAGDARNGKPRRVIAASTSSSSPTGVAARTPRITRRFSGAKVCSRGSWPQLI